jgi:hypothetical protein
VDERDVVEQLGEPLDIVGREDRMLVCVDMQFLRSRYAQRTAHSEFLRPAFAAVHW